VRARACANKRNMLPPWVAERGTGGWDGMGCTAEAHCAHVDDRRRDSACGCGCGGGTFERHTACCMLHATPYARFFFFLREAHHVDDRVREHVPLRSLVRAQQRLRGRSAAWRPLRGDTHECTARPRAVKRCIPPPPCACKRARAAIIPACCENAANAYACARKRARVLVLVLARGRACVLAAAGRCLGSIGRQLRRDFEREQQQRLVERHGEEGRNVGLLPQAIPPVSTAEVASAMLRAQRDRQSETGGGWHIGTLLGPVSPPPTQRSLMHLPCVPMCAPQLRSERPPRRRRERAREGYGRSGGRSGVTVLYPLA
jgi:hypothetical protein